MFLISYWLSYPFFFSPSVRAGSIRPLFFFFFRTISIDSLFFIYFVILGRIQTGVKSTGHAGWRLAQARQVHRDVCSLLSASAESLRSARRRFLNELPEEQHDEQQHSTRPLRGTSADDQHIPASTSQVTLGGGGRDGHSSDCEEEFVAAANNEIGQLCAHNVLLWRKLLDAFAGSEPVRLMLAQQHHANRVRRFAEAFYVVNHPRPAMANCNDADVHTYLYVTEALRKSR